MSVERVLRRARPLDLPHVRRREARRIERALKAAGWRAAPEGLTTREAVIAAHGASAAVICDRVGRAIAKSFSLGLSALVTRAKERKGAR